MAPTRRAAAAIAALLAGQPGLSGAFAQEAPVPAAVAAPTSPAGPPPASQAGLAPQLGAAVPQPDPAPPAAAEAPPPPMPAPGDPVAEVVAARLADANFALVRRLPRKEREAIQAFYALGAFKAVWVADGAWTPAAKAAIARLQAAGDDGLDPLAYPIPLLDAPRAGPADLAEADLKLSAAVALYARDARGGRIEPWRLSKHITPKLDLPGADAVLTRLVTAGPAADATLQGYNPQQPGYLALKARLAALRAQQPGRAVPMVRLPKGPTLKTGMRDPARVPLIRARFGLGGAADATAYDDAVAGAVAGFQRERGLKVTGLLTPDTVAALAGPAPGRQEADLLSNMERWRWLPADLGQTHVWVNIPDMKVRVVRDGRTVDEKRAIIGKPESPTPVFSGEMTYAVVNPSWTVPPSILKNQFLPRLAQDPNYAARLGYEVVRRGNGIAIRQPPGERNALGFIKFMFPNDHAVYLHDTPNRSLFARSDRALSHGCVRVDDPFRFAEVVLGPTWPTERLRKLIGKGERTVMLPHKLPVHLAYFTTLVDETGALRSAPDVYGFDARVKVALGLATEAPPAAEVRKPKPKPAPPANVAQHAPRPRARAVEAAEIPAAGVVQPDDGFFAPPAVRRGWW